MYFDMKGCKTPTERYNIASWYAKNELSSYCMKTSALLALCVGIGTNSVFNGLLSLAISYIVYKFSGNGIDESMRPKYVTPDRVGYILANSYSDEKMVSSLSARMRHTYIASNAIMHAITAFVLK